MRNPRVITAANGTDMNVSVRSDNRSGISGVFWNKRDEKWQVMLKFNNRTISLGRYADLDLAALVATTCRGARAWLVEQQITVTQNEVKEYLQRVARSAANTKAAVDHQEIWVLCWI